MTSTHLGRNRCYVCERSPYTLLFYQRETRADKYVQISASKEYKKVYDALFSPKARGPLFDAARGDVLMSGSLVNWDTVKLRLAEEFVMELDEGFHDRKKKERRAAARRRGTLRRGVATCAWAGRTGPRGSGGARQHPGGDQAVNEGHARGHRSTGKGREVRSHHLGLWELRLAGPPRAESQGTRGHPLH